MKNSLVLLLLLALAGQFSAQELTLDACRQMALKQNKEIAISSHQVHKATLTTEAYKTNFLPKFSAQALGFYTTASQDLKIKIGEINLFNPADLAGSVPQEMLPILGSLATVNIPDLAFRLQTNNSYMAGLNFEQPLYLGGKISAAWKMSKIGEEIAQLHQAATEDEVLVAVDKAYWMYVQALELKESAQLYEQTVDEFLRVVNNALQAGMKSKNDQLKVQVRQSQAQLQLQRTENAVTLARMNLCSVIGLPLDRPITPSATLRQHSILIEPDDNIHARPQYAMLTKQIELKGQEKRLIRSDFMPQLGLSGSYNYMHGIRLNGDPLFDNGSLSAILSLKIPLFNWGEGAKKIRAAEQERVIMQLQRDHLSEQMELERRQALNQYTEALLEVELTQHSLAQSEENLKVSRDAYDVGMETTADYLEAQTLRQQAHAEYIVAKTKLEISKVNYLKAIGKL